jgi:hypothetical protein
MKKAATILVTMIFLASCGQVQTTPAAEPTLVVPTVTSAPTDISIPFMAPTSTLEPWMRSLPEGVVTVEVEDEQIVGLDADGNQAMVYSLNTGEWETLTEQAPVEEVEGMIFDEKVVIQEHPMLVKLSNGADVSGSLVLMETTDPSDDELLEMKIFLPEESAEFLQFEALAQYVHYHGLIPGEGELDQVKRESIAQKLLAVQKGEVPVSEMLVKALVLDNADLASGKKERVLAFFTKGKSAGQGEVLVNQVNFALFQGADTDYVNATVTVKDDWPGLYLNEAGIGFGAVLDGDTLWLLVAPGYNVNESNAQKAVPARVAALMQWIKLHDTARARAVGTPESAMMEALIESGFAVTVVNK